MSEASSKTSLSYLQNMGVTIMTETFVKDYDGKVGNAFQWEIHTNSHLNMGGWCKGNKLNGLPDDIWVANDRVLVDRFNKVQGFDTNFAIGDIAYMTTEKYPKAHPPNCQRSDKSSKIIESKFSKYPT